MVFAALSPCLAVVFRASIARTPFCLIPWCSPKKENLLFGGGALGAKRKIVQNAAIRGKHHDNKTSEEEILLSRNFVVVVVQNCAILSDQNYQNSLANGDFLCEQNGQN